MGFIFKKIKEHRLVPPKKRFFDELPEAVVSPRRNRWMMKIPFENGEVHMWVRTERPTLIEGPGGTFDYHLIPSSWRNMEISIIDYIGYNGYEQIVGWYTSVLRDAFGRHGYGGDGKKTIVLENYDPTGIVIESYTLQGCLITRMGNESMEISIDRSIVVF